MNAQFFDNNMFDRNEKYDADACNETRKNL